MSIHLNPKLVVIIVYVTAMFMVAMDGTIVNVALPAIGGEYQIPPSATGGINVGYLVSLAVFLPIAGWLGDRWGTKRIFLIALSVFTVASALCGVANDISTLNLFRIFQGAAGGLLTPVGMAMLFRTFPKEERAKVSRSLVLPIAIAPALGPIIGGLLVEQLSWRWVFYINIPFGILACLFGLIFLIEHKEREAGRLDLLGFLLSAPGFSMLMYALNQGPSKGWDSPIILVTGICGLILVCFLVLVELQVNKPMLDLRLLSDRLFRMTGIISLFSAAGLLGMLYVFPLMYQNALHASALESGLTTFPEALGLMIASRMMPWSCKKLGVRQVISSGLLCAVIVFVLISVLGPSANPWILRVLLLSVGFFLGHAVVAVQFATFTNISSVSMGRATTLFNVQNRLGSAIGVALLASILGVLETSTAAAAQNQFDSVPYQAALLGAAAFLLIAFFFAQRIRKDDVAAIELKTSPVHSSHTESVAKVSK
ncbi:DHA2 family efflux MFS transporter permease subunit [Priestia megaterium]|nr:DHA2 family efflux MFS transporter permease subunit [Priestia megaterium]